MEKYFPGSTAMLVDFEIANVPMENLQKFVNLYFGINANYYDAKVSDSIPIYSQDLVKRTINMIQSPDEFNLDGRRKALEIQFSPDFNMR